jgi:hypothetical protein
MTEFRDAQREALRRLEDPQAPLWEAPPDLEPSILARLDQPPGPKTARPATRTRILQAALAGAALLAVGFGLGRLGLSDDQTVAVRLTFQATGVQSVAVAGDWNGWSPTAQPLIPVGTGGTWEVTVRVKRGMDLHYQFVVDKTQWVPDPQSSIRVSDRFGGTNSVIHL